jgi:hypothetical protein
MPERHEKSRSNVLLALFLGAVALGFFILGMYLSTGGGGG